jgi:hypothetical protein
MAMARDAREDAVQRLEAALSEQGRVSERFRTAIGTSAELGAYARLRDASDEVDARDAALRSIDGDGYRGRAWINGREIGGPDSLFVGLEDSHD